MHDLFKSIGDLYTKQRELAAIWLDKSVVTGEGKTLRIAEGATVAIKDGELVDVADKPTHKVLACFGAMSNQFEIAVINLETNEPSIIKL